MRTRALGLLGLGVCLGCVGEAPLSNARWDAAEEVLRSEPAAVPTVTAEGEGVALRWPGGVALQARSEGLGAVVWTRSEAPEALSLMHPRGVEERWTVRPDGAEQSWRFPSRPAGDRVAVTVTLTGVALARS